MLSILENYLKDTGISKSAFAKKIGKTREYIYHIIEGRYKPSYEVAQKMEQATDGKLNYKELMGIKEKKRKQEKDLNYFVLNIYEKVTKIEKALATQQTAPTQQTSSQHNNIHHNRNVQVNVTKKTQLPS